MTTSEMVRSDSLEEEFARIAVAAAVPIMAIYRGTIDVDYKSDGSPCTLADEAAEEIILSRLAALVPDMPVLAEESASAGLPMLGDTFIAVDPLDGTREFINRRDEFTVNIALIRARQPVAGAVYAPALGKLWFGSREGGAFAMELQPGERLEEAARRRRIRARPRPDRGLTAVASRSHSDAATEAFLEGLDIAGRTSIGSSLKFCLIAEGSADVYPRFGPTMEWDTAAGHAVVAAAGGRVVTPEDEPFLYGRADAGYRNGSFVAWGA